MVAMRPRHLYLSLLAATACCLLVAPPSGAQSAAPEPQPAPVIRKNARLVLVDVVVTANGKPVEGLPEGRFHVLEDGKAQTITSFEEHRASDAPLVAAAPSLPPHVSSNDPQFAIESAANVLLLDGLNTPLSDQQQARRQMLEYLKQIPAETRIAVFTLASQLRMISGFTTDAGAVEAAILPGARQSTVLETPQDQDTMNDIATSMSGVDGGAMQQFVADSQTYQTDVRVSMTLDALRQLTQYLSMIPGRKNLIWLSGSFPLQIQPNAPPGESGASPGDPLFSSRDYSSEAQAVDALLAAARVAVYPVDARGLMPPESADVSRSFNGGQGLPSMGGGSGQRRGGLAPAMTSGPSAANQADRMWLQEITNEFQTMQRVAEETGGEAFYNTNGLKEAAAQAIGEGSNYYTISYVPAGKEWDGRFRTIRVRIDGDPYNLAYRRGYYAEDPQKPGPEMPGVVSPIVAALERGAPPLGAIRFEARVLAASDPAAKAARPQAGPAGEMAAKLKQPIERYLVDLSVDPHAMEWSALQGNVAHAEIEVAMAAWDANGQRVNYTDKAFAINLNPQQSALVLKSGLPIHQEIDLPSGAIYLRIAVHDLRNARIGSLEVPLMVGKIPEISARRR